MAIFYVLPSPSTSPYGVTTSKNRQHLLFETINEAGKTSTKTIQVEATRAPRKNFTNPTDVFSVPTNSRTGQYNVFSTEPVKNNFYKTKDALPSNWIQNPEIKNEENISEQTYYELKHNVAPGTYNIDGFNMKNPSTEKTFFQNFRFSLNAEGITILDTKNPKDEIIYLIFKKSSESYNSNFAMSLQDLYGKNAAARYYIADVEVEREAKLKYQRKGLGAAAKLSTALDTLSESKLYKIATVLKLVSGKTSKEGVEEKLLDYLNQTSDADRNKEKLVNVIKQASETNLADAFEIDYLIQECINQKVITPTPDAYLWHSQKGTNRYELAKTIERLAKLLADTKNKEIVEMLKDELKQKGYDYN